MADNREICYAKFADCRKTKCVSAKKAVAMIQKVLIVISLTFSLFHYAICQPTFTADDSIVPYKANFYYGCNMGYYPPWTDKTLADIAAGSPAKNVPGAGVKTLRASLPENFLEQWGYTIRVNEFNYYDTLGVHDLTVFIGIPSEAHRDHNHYGTDTLQSKMFANMFTPIWDNGKNGTPVNDSNYYALYVYKTVKQYGAHVKFWEIMNEPDFDFTGNGWKSSGQAGNWFDANPKTGDLYNMRAPIFHYIRMLRISYEVIKSIDPAAYVATGGLGYPGFLDAVLRNTDNPIDGSVTNEYLRKGGAYFDVLSYHVYPQYDAGLKHWDNTKGGFVYNRNSDAATEGVTNTKKAFQVVLNKYGYNGSTHPSKEWIITECNIPRKRFGEDIGGDEVQRNFIIKTLVTCQSASIRQFHVYMLGENVTEASAADGYDVMGLYGVLKGVAPYSQVINNEGVAYKTTSDILLGTTCDSGRTNKMTLPSGVLGGAFVDKNGGCVYVLWAKTIHDTSESASASYTFPTDVYSGELELRNWNYSKTKLSSKIHSSSVQLTGAPVFLLDDKRLDVKRSIQILPVNKTVRFAVRGQKIIVNGLSILGTDEIRILLCSLRGEKISDLTQEYADKSSVTLDCQSIPDGSYVLRLTNRSMSGSVGAKILITK